MLCYRQEVTVGRRGPVLLPVELAGLQGTGGSWLKMVLASSLVL